jgi:LacI family transcriptional regulator
MLLGSGISVRTIVTLKLSIKAMKRQTVMMRDVAERAGVSISTVSRILRSERLESFSVQTRERVEAIANELGWRPNILVQGIQKGLTDTIGVIIPPYDTFWKRLLYGVHDGLLSVNKVPLILWPQEATSPETGPGSANPTPRLELTRLHRLVDRRVDGIIAWPLIEDDALAFLAQISKNGLPVVTIDHRLPRSVPSLSLEVDEDRAMSLLVEHLRSLGHRRLGYLGFRSEHSWACNRRKAFAKAAGEHAVAEVAVRQHYDDPAEGVRAILKEHSGITAILSATDHLALHSLRGARLAGRSVPTDLSVTGFGDLEFEQRDLLPLTTINQDPFGTGRRAVEEVLRPDAFTHSRSEMITPRLVVRASTAPAKGR